MYDHLPDTRNEIVFLGNSITDGAEWYELLGNKRIRNRGISADVTEGILLRLDAITKLKPAKIFIMIGVNDIARNMTIRRYHRQLQDHPGKDQGRESKNKSLYRKCSAGQSCNRYGTQPHKQDRTDHGTERKAEGAGN